MATLPKTNTTAQSQRGISKKVFLWSIYCIFGFISLFSISYFLTVPASALTTVPTKMNFQGRLTTSAGNIMPDGLYNMRFRLFTVSSGGVAVWTETREVGSRVQVTNGLFSVKLGDVTPIPASLFTSGELYFEIELPTPATATCSTASCASFTEGAMTPRNQLLTSAYAFNSETLDGLDSAAFAQLAADNTFTGTNLFRRSADHATAFQVQDAAGMPVLTVDTLTNNVMIGNDTPEESLDVIGNWQVRDGSTATKSSRMRTNGADLDFEAGGDNLWFSTWTNANYTGTQYFHMTLNSDGSPITFWRAAELFNAVASDVALTVVGATGQTASLLQLYTASDGILTLNVSSTGATTFKNSTNSASAFQVQNASSVNVLRVSTLGTDNAVTATAGSTTVVNGPRALQLDSAAGSSGVVMGWSVAGTERAMMRANLVGDLVINSTGSGKLLLNNDSGTGGIQVGTATNKNNVTINGTAATCTLGNGTGATNCTSDRRLKTNIHEYNGVTSLDKVMGLKPVNFEWLNQDAGNRGVKLGLIAQEVQEVLPEFVAEVGDSGHLGIDYAALVTPIIGAVQEQQRQINRLQDAIGMDDLKIIGHVIGNEDTRGRVMIAAGKTSVTHRFSDPYKKQPFVVASPEGRFAAYYVSANKESLTIHLSQPASADQWFTFMVQE